MRLTELEPHWVGLNPNIAFWFGVSFLCPCCKTKRLAVLFNPPIDPENWADRIIPLNSDGAHLRIDGETFDTLTLSPSVGFDHAGHWHGHIIGGEATSA